MPGEEISVSTGSLKTLEAVLLYLSIVVPQTLGLKTTLNCLQICSLGRAQQGWLIVAGCCISWSSWTGGMENCKMILDMADELVLGVGWKLSKCCMCLLGQLGLFHSVVAGFQK